jgi:hypothetical protein
MHLHAPFTSATTSGPPCSGTSECALTKKNLTKHLQHAGQPWNDPNSSHLPRQKRAVGISNALKSLDNNPSQAVIGKAAANSDGMAPMERYLGLEVARPLTAKSEDPGVDERRFNPTNDVAYWADLLEREI